MRAIFIILVVTSGLIAVKSDNRNRRDYKNITELLPYLNMCKRQNPFMEWCIKQSIESIGPYLAKGITELNIPSFEPYYIKNYEFSSMNTFNATAKYTNINIHGVTNFYIKNVRILDDIFKIKIDAYFPSVRLQANYSIDGIITDIPIRKGEGIINGFFTGIAGDIIIDSTCNICPMLTYFKPHTVSVKLRMEGAQTYMNNLGTFFYIDTLNKRLNEIWRTIAREILPAIELTTSHVIMTTVNSIYSRFPIKELMPI